MLRFDKDGTLYFACTNCFTLIRLHGVDTRLSRVVFRNKNEKELKVKLFLESRPTLICCPNCGMYYYDCHEEDEGDLFEVDPDIALDILELNRKGYRTHFSCQSHYDYSFCEDKELDFYIMIDLPNQIVRDKILPHDFTCEVSPNQFDLGEDDWDHYTYILRHDTSIYRRKYPNDVTEYHFMNGETRYTVPREVWEKEYPNTLKNFEDWVKELPDLSNSGDSIIELDYDVEEWV